MNNSVRNKWTVALCGVAVSVLFLVIALQFRTITELKTMKRSEGHIEYILYSFKNPLSPQELAILDSITDKSRNKLCIFIPAGVCRACILSLMANIQAKGLGSEDVSLSLTIEDEYLRQEIRARGFGDISFIEASPEAYDILISGESSNIWQRNYMRYKDGFDAPLRVFLEDIP